MDTKPWYYSKTIWLTVILTVIAILQGLPAEALPPKLAVIVQSILGVLIIINRALSAPTTLTTTKQEGFNG